VLHVSTNITNTHHTCTRLDGKFSLTFSGLLIVSKETHEVDGTGFLQS